MRRRAGAWRLRASLPRFAVVGAANTMLVYAAFSILMRHHVHYALACCASWCAGLASSYLLNRGYTFRAGGPVIARELATFLLGYVLQLGLGLLVYAVLIDHFGVRYQLAFLINLVFVSVFSYAFMSRLVFRAPSENALSVSGHGEGRPGLALGSGR